MTNVHLAQINIGRMKAPLDDPAMAGFVWRLADLNALADGSDGFVWRLQGGEGNNTYLRPYEDERIIVNMSVWESVEALHAYVYSSAHAEVLKQRRDWFEKFDGVIMALWWIPAGHIPSVDEAKQRLASLERDGPTPFAFTFKTVFPPILAVATAAAERMASG
jgi:heme-degrading monooxygenase HmoA